MPICRAAARRTARVYEFNAERQAKRASSSKKRKAGRAGRAPTIPAPTTPWSRSPMEQKADAAPAAAAAKPPSPSRCRCARQIFLNEATARYRAAINAEIGLVERLVWFWSNHFCVSFDSTVMAGAYEREAIRPHVLGRFADMLLAAESHPAMLIYLDNAQIDRPQLGRRHQPRPRPQRESGARNPRAAYARGADRLCASRRHQFRQGHHRLDDSSRPSTIRITAASSCSTSACTSPPRRP